MRETDKFDSYFDPDMRNKLIKKSEYREIKKSVIYSLIMILISNLASVLSVFVLMIPALFFSELENNVVYIKTMEMVAYTAQMVLPVIFFVALSGRTLRYIYNPGIYAYPRQEYERVTPLSVLGYFLAAMAMSQTASVVSSLITELFSYFGSLISPELILDNAAYETVTPTSVTEFVLDFIAVALLPAILEEIFFRGVLLGEFLKYGKSFAICISAFFFASVHGSIDQMMYSFVYGIIFGYIAVRTGSVTTGIIIHFLNNAYSCIVDYLFNMYDTELFVVVISVIDLLAIVAGLMFIIYKTIKDKFVYTEIKDEYKKPCVLREAEKFRIFVSLPMVAYYVYIAFDTLYVYISYNIRT